MKINTFTNIFLYFYYLTICYLCYISSEEINFYYIIKYNSEHSEFLNETYLKPPYRDKQLFIPQNIESNIVKSIKLMNKDIVKIVVTVLSSPYNFKKRYSFRRTYKKYNNLQNSKIIFFTGSSTTENRYILEKEISLYNDVVQFSFQNSYFNLTLLSIMALKYCCEHFANIEYYIKTDDDMLINYKILKMIIYYLAPNNSIIYGHLQKRKKVIRNNNSINYIPYSQYPHEYMPQYVYGGLIIITKILLQSLYNQTLYRQQHVWREDMNLGILCLYSRCKMKQFPYDIDIQINSQKCNISNNVVAKEIKSYSDIFYCI